MSRPSLGFLVVLLGAVIAGCSSGSSDAPVVVPADDAAQLLTDRNWMDAWPHDKGERLHVFRFTPSMGGGVYQDRTLYKGTFELFVYRVQRDAILFTLPETEEQVRAKFRIERVKGPRPFDLRLTLENSPRGPSVYYGREAETAGSALELNLPSEAP